MQGDFLTVRLPSNPSTGFSWKIELIPVFLELVDELEFVPDTQGTGMVGVGGVTIWKFYVSGSGTGVLGFVYRRLWETAPPIETVEYTLTAMP